MRPHTRTHTYIHSRQMQHFQSSNEPAHILGRTDKMRYTHRPTLQQLCTLKLRSLGVRTNYVQGSYCKTWILSTDKPLIISGLCLEFLVDDLCVDSSVRDAKRKLWNVYLCACFWAGGRRYLANRHRRICCARFSPLKVPTEKQGKGRVCECECIPYPGAATPGTPTQWRRENCVHADFCLHTDRGNGVRHEAVILNGARPVRLQLCAFGAFKVLGMCVHRALAGSNIGSAKKLSEFIFIWNADTRRLADIINSL